jgi:4-aminobutyrate aminotransferase
MTNKKRLIDGLRATLGDKPYVNDIRGEGCMIGVEFTADCPAGTKAKVSSACHQEGMVMLGTSTFETMRFIPPLVISEEQVDMAVNKFEKACATVFGGLA